MEAAAVPSVVPGAVFFRRHCFGTGFCPGDGQSVIPKKFTMHDPELAAQCIEYYARTRKLYPGMEWLKET